MSEPAATASSVSTLVPGLRHWTVDDERIGFRSDAYAVRGPDGWVLIDPLPWTATAGGRLDPIAAICLTGPFHQRSAWRLRREHGVAVFAPSGAGYDEPADHDVREGGELPGGLVPFDRPGPTTPHYVLFQPDLDGGAIFVGDLLMRHGDGPLVFVPDTHHEDPARTRRSLRALLDLRARWVCPAHGVPRREPSKRVFSEALRLDRARPGQT